MPGDSRKTRKARSGCATRTAIRAPAPRLGRDAVRALATGRVGLASENPSQGRRSLSRFPASGPQGFWPVELNLRSGSKSPMRHGALAAARRVHSISFRFHDLRLLAAGRRTILFVVIRIVRAHPARERGAQNVGGEEIAPVSRHHDDLQFV
jgi:hypothetical protein